MRTVRSADGTPIAYERSGDGPPVILVSGALSDRGTNAEIARLLSTDFTVLNYDRRGRGDSGDTPPYSVEREVADIAALIDAAGGSAYLWGSSSGAALALTATASGLPVTRLALWEPPFNLHADGVRVQREYRAELTALLEENRRGDAVALFMRLVGLPDEVIAQMRSAPMWPALERLAHTLRYDNTVLRDGSLPLDEAAAVTVPTLVLSGGASPGWMSEVAKRIADAVPAGRHEVLPDQEHNVAAEALVPALAAFFRVPA